MPRKSTREEAAQYMQGFFDEAKDRLTQKMLKTMQPKRRDAMFKTIQAIDLVEAEFYNWQNGIDEDAA